MSAKVRRAMKPERDGVRLVIALGLGLLTYFVVRGVLTAALGSDPTATSALPVHGLVSLVIAALVTFAAYRLLNRPANSNR